MTNSLRDDLNVPDYVQIGTANMLGSITGSSIYNNAGFSGSQIGSGGLTTVHYSSQSVSGSVIASGGVTTVHYFTESVSGSVIGSGGIGVQHLNALPGDVTAFTHFAAVKTGSPAAGGKFVQAGSAALSAGSAAWVVFGAPFGAAPQVSISPYTNYGGIFVAAGSINAGSFYAEGETASSVFGWHAIGSG